MRKKIKSFFDEDELNEEINEKINHYERPKRKIDEMLFHGSGALSQIMWKVVLQRLDEGHATLCGLQQGGDKKEQKEGDEIIKDVLRDILASFGYSTNVNFRKVPYKYKHKKYNLNQLTLQHELETNFKNKIACGSDKWLNRKDKESFDRITYWLNNKDYDNYDED